MHAASALLTTRSIVSLETVISTRTSLSASAATCQTGNKGMLQWMASCAGLGQSTVRVAEVAEVAEGVRIFAIGFRKLQACPPALFGNSQRLRFSDSSVIAFLAFLILLNSSLEPIGIRMP